MPTIRVKQPQVPMVVMPHTMLTNRFMFDDGEVIDIVSPYKDSRVNEFALKQAEKKWGKREDRKIVGYTIIKKGVLQ